MAHHPLTRRRVLGAVGVVAATGMSGLIVPARAQGLTAP